MALIQGCQCTGSHNGTRKPSSQSWRPGVEIPAGLPDREVYLFYEDHEHVPVTR